MNPTTPLKHCAKQVKDTGFLLTGLGYKIMKEGQLTEEKQTMINEMTDSVISCADTILNEAKKLETRETERVQRMEALKKDAAISKRKLSEAVLERDNLEGECQKLRRERDRLDEECKRLKTDLNASQTSLAAMSFDADDDSLFEQSASVADLLKQNSPE